MDAKLEKLFAEYIAINNDEKDGDLTEVADRIKAYQEELFAKEGHTGIDEVTDGRS